MSSDLFDNYKHLPKMKPPYKNEINMRYSQQLFLEQWVSVPVDMRTHLPPFSLYGDRYDLINFGREYINDCDQTGYTTSLRLLGEYPYWAHLMKAKWFREAKEKWDEEIDAKLYAEGLAKIRDLAMGDDAKALQAAKFLANKEYKKAAGTKTIKTRGRPSNEEIEGNLKKLTEDEIELQEAAQRIGLTIVSGNK